MERGNYYLRDLKSIRYHEQNPPPDFKRFVAEAVWPLLGLRGYKVAHKQAVATHVCHNLIVAGLVAKCVADTRDTARPGVRERAAIWKAIIAAGLARACKGSQEARRVTRYYVTAKLIELRDEWTLDGLVELPLARNTTLNAEAQTRHALVCIYTGKLDPATGRAQPKQLRRQLVPIAAHVRNRAQRRHDGKPDPRAVANGLAHYAAIEDIIERINQANLDRTWKAFATDPLSGRA